jgi:hypothetical protein
MTLAQFDKLAKSNTEHAHQRAFFAWVNAARLFGFAGACGITKGIVTDKELQEARSVPGRSSEECKLPELALFHAIPNGGMRDKITAGKLKAEGAKAGVLDTFLPVPKEYTVPGNAPDGQSWQAWYMGLYIEFKEPGRKTHKNGGLSDAQVEFCDMVREQGYCVRVAYTWREGANLVMAYYGVDWRIDTA